MPSTVLVITTDSDSHANAVIAELQRRDVPVFRFHPEDFPHACSVSIGIRDGHIEGEIKTSHRRIDFDDICAAWFRRARNVFAERTNLTSEKLDNYIKAQSNATVIALCESLSTLWVGNPHLLRRAEIKALQLVEAARAGLTTPLTLISNDPTQAAAFVDALGSSTECAIKPLITIGVTDEHGYRLPFTTTIPAGYSLESVALAPNIFQPYIEKAFELRCVVIGDRVFSARIDSQADDVTRQDWRAGSRSHAAFDLPDEIAEALLRVVGAFGLNFASLDMIVTPRGEFVFLELNPNGQWLWLEHELGLPLVSAMADLLTSQMSAVPNQFLAA